MNLNELIRAFALLNAAKYNGKASVKAVLGQIFGKYPEYRKNPMEVRRLTEEIINKLNNLTLDEIKEEIKKLPPELKEEKKYEEKKELPPLPKINRQVVMRLAPFPSGPLHIGNARMVILNDYYVKRYKGKLILVYDDTIGSEEKQIVPEAYDMIIEGLDWLDVKYHEIIYKSDRIEKTYEYCRTALEKNLAYVCTCDAKDWREQYKIKARPCPHRNQVRELNLEEWDKMLDGAYEEQEAVVRLKIGMDNPNPAVRDPVIMRISKRPHPRVGTKYSIWPLLEFSWAIDDHLLGITHILRGKDLVKEDYIEQWIWEQFGWPVINFIHYGLIKFKGLKLSKTQSRMNIELKKYIGWDDPRTWSLQSLMKRGIQPATIREAILSLGLSKTDIEYSPLALYAINKKLIDPIASRYFFTPNPLKLVILNIPFSEIYANPLVHPEHPEKGKRTIPLPISDGVAEVYIPGDEGKLLKPGQILRLKDLFNITILNKQGYIEAEFKSKALEDARKINAPIIQWVPLTDCIKIQMLMPDGTLIDGFGEPSCRELKIGQVIQFERVGFVRVNQLKPSILVYFAHK